MSTLNGFLADLTALVALIALFAMPFIIARSIIKRDDRDHPDEHS